MQSICGTIRVPVSHTSNPNFKIKCDLDDSVGYRFGVYRDGGGLEYVFSSQNYQEYHDQLFKTIKGIRGE